jgi:tRNA pseudouridine55 synthase
MQYPNLLIVNKPKGFTSNDIVQMIKKHFHYQKVGHGGTLDPNATGVLVIGINEGTKALHGLTNDHKQYIAEVKFGASTDTYDVEGKITKHASFEHIKLEDIRSIFERLKKEGYQQTPPIYSAIKIKGKKLYDYARQQQTVEIIPRATQILDYEIKEFHDGSLTIKIDVPKGFYVRSLAHDLGV